MPSRSRTQVKISPRPAPVRKDASPGQGNERGNTIGRTAGNTAERCGRRVHPHAKLPDKVVPWVLLLLCSWHPPRHERGRREGNSAGTFHHAHFVDAAASNIHPSVGSSGHVAHRAAAGRNDRARKLFRLGIALYNGVWFHAGLALPNHSVGSNRSSIWSSFL